MNPTRSGRITSEFWVTLAGIVLTLLVSAGLLTADAADLIRVELPEAIAAVATLVGIAVMVWRYVASREAVKTEALKSQAAVQMMRQSEPAVQMMRQSERQH